MAWSSGTAANSYPYLETGTDLLSIRASPTVASAAFLGSGAGSQAGDVYFYKNVSMLGTLACSGQMTGKMFFCAGKVNADGTKASTSSSSFVNFTTSVSSNTYTITFSSNHPAGSNYVIQVTGQAATATVLNTNPPTAASFRVVLYSAASPWPTTTLAPFSFTVLH